MYTNLMERHDYQSLARSIHLLNHESPLSLTHYQPLYDRLANHIPTQHERELAADVVREFLEDIEDSAPALDTNNLTAWMDGNVQEVHAQYQAYLDQRKAGAPRRYFSNRAHALYFLRNVAPTKLVDGSWLYGLCAHADNQRFSDLVTTYVEELGDGQAEKNHVKLYRALLAKYGLDPLDDLPDSLYQQGLVQVALGWNAQDFLPEIVGFNLGYEQLPLHLLISAYELNELGIDPYYFTLHVTVDNADTGHARRACSAALNAAPRIDDDGEYWRRVRAGVKLGNIGVGTVDVIQAFDIDQEVVAIFARKAQAGHGAHSDFCTVGGRSVNDWLSNPDDITVFLWALEQAKWIRRNEPVAESRFWHLLVGDRAEMFGVFSPYELQVIHDWIRGSASADGAPYATSVTQGTETRQMSFRVAERMGKRRPNPADHAAPELDTDLQIFEERFPHLGTIEKKALLVQVMSPALHWTPVGLLATKLFLSQ